MDGGNSICSCSHCFFFCIGLLLHYLVPGPEVIKLFSCSTQLRMTFILLVNVKMSTIVGILTFISRINIPSEQDNLVIFQYFTFYEQSKCRAQLVEHETSFITSGPGTLSSLAKDRADCFTLIALWLFLLRVSSSWCLRLVFSQW